MYAIVETGSKQYRLSKGDVVRVERLGAKKDKDVKLNNVLLIADKKDITVGKPFIKGASVVCEYTGDVKDKKVISFRYRRRLGNSKKKIGHRQGYSVLKVKDIKVGG